ncbi:hypothetical protein H2200_007466 [Cladophialophora chaetospira]|uniref:Thioredoxin-like fold domain-containing protein n=1 Tax=Cladophialophora chaetospira TaxID=386627 RepID=A0AA38X806_9EURO|nr:hypothetical protein H2200_007466 [Cladophialophora chaetospira]
MASSQPKSTLYRGSPDHGGFGGSPFSTKLEFRFRHAKLPYNVAAGSPKTGPKGKVPYVDLSVFQTSDASAGPSLMGDSTFIIQHLLASHRLPDLNEDLSDEQRLNDLALRALLEEKLYFYLMRERWLDNYYTQRDTALYAIPYPIRIFVGLLVHRTVTSTLHGQGVGRLTGEEVRGLETEIWQTLESVLEQRMRKATPQKVFWALGGKQPTEADATLFGFIVSVLATETAPESKKMVKKFPCVSEYAKRIHRQYFPDYEMWT